MGGGVASEGKSKEIQDMHSTVQIPVSLPNPTQSVKARYLPCYLSYLQDRVQWCL